MTSNVWREWRRPFAITGAVLRADTMEAWG